MEFGAVSCGELIYSGDVIERTPAELEAFLNRVRAWKAKHDLEIGEGIMRTIEYDGVVGYLLKAPIIGRRAGFHEIIREESYPIQPESDKI